MAGVDLSTLKELLGHQDIKSRQVYAGLPSISTRPPARAWRGD
jgi:site-specific recombinase XerD